MSRRITCATLGAAAVAAIPLAYPVAAPAARAPVVTPAVTVIAGPPWRTPPPGVPKQSDAMAFVPSPVTVTVGQTVRFRFNGFHTVTFAGPRGTSKPLIVPSTDKSPQVNGANGVPFWWAGTTPQLQINPLWIPQVGGLTIRGPQLHSSGLARIVTAGKKGPAPYDVTFTKPGVYHYECVVHSILMKGVVRVLPAKRRSPALAAAAKKRTAVQTATLIATLKRLATVVPTDPTTVNVGLSVRNGAQLLTMSPGTLTVNAGQTVTFQNTDLGDVHTVTFGPEALRSQLEKTFVMPTGTGTSMRLLINSQAAYPSEPPTTVQPIAYDGTSHGDGFLNSGLLLPNGTPAAAGPTSFRVTFSKPGTYNFECVIHPNMDGTIVVK